MNTVKIGKIYKLEHISSELYLFDSPSWTNCGIIEKYILTNKTLFQITKFISGKYNQSSIQILTTEGIVGWLLLFSDNLNELELVEE